MLSRRLKVDTANVTQGMFIAQLDRSWLETPFSSHGFEVSGSEQIGLLRKFCKHVYVDVVRSSLPEATILQAHQSANAGQDPFVAASASGTASDSGGLGHKLLHSLGRLDPTGIVARRMAQHTTYQRKTTVAKEIPDAIAAYRHARKRMRWISARVTKGATVDIDILKEAVEPMIDSILRNPDAMAGLGYLRKYKLGDGRYSVDVAIWSLVLGRHMGFSLQQLRTLAMGSLLLDIGNTRLPESMAAQQGKLSPEELEIMQTHVDYGVEIAVKSPGINDDIIAMIDSHHERSDSSGYPRGLAQDDIPVYGRIAGIADCYDAMISHLPYAAAISSYDAVRELTAMAGVQFQREIVEHFIQAVGMFPTGSLVELNTGEVALVTEQNPLRRLRPMLLILLNADKQPIRQRKILNLARCPANVGKRKARWIIAGFEAGAFGINPIDIFVGQ